jgi:hypothetical protein
MISFGAVSPSFVVGPIVLLRSCRILRPTVVQNFTYTTAYNDTGVQQATVQTTAAGATKSILVRNTNTSDRAAHSKMRRDR